MAVASIALNQREKLATMVLVQVQPTAPLTGGLTVAKDFAQGFYKSKAWQQCRDAYAASVGGLCEECLKDGKISAGEIVHHKIHLTPDTINDPTISLSWDNLELVCRSCHLKLHGNRKRYSVDAFGRVIPR